MVKNSFEGARLQCTEELIFRPAGAFGWLPLYPRLAPWAVFLRCPAARTKGSVYCDSKSPSLERLEKLSFGFADFEA